MSGDYITILFVTTYDKSEFPEKFLLFLEYLAHPSDYGLTELHAEIIAGNTGYSAVGRPPDHCVIKYNFDHAAFDSQPFVEFVKVPITDLKGAVEILEDMSTTSATYDIPWMDFLVPSIFIKDLDLDPHHWGHLYCSQFVLLFLRKCRKKNLLPLPEDRLVYLDSCKSETCTPTHLKRMLDKICKK